MTWTEFPKSNAMALLQRQLNEWAMETGDHPRKIVLPDNAFDQICAESAAFMMKTDTNILKMIQSIRISTSIGYIIVERFLGEGR